MGYMDMTEEDFARFEEEWLDRQTYYATGGCLDFDDSDEVVIQKEMAACSIGAVWWRV